jgi:hypothetical protein
LAEKSREIIFLNWKRVSFLHFLRSEFKTAPKLRTSRALGANADGEVNAGGGNPTTPAIPTTTMGRCSQIGV